ncbi:hypothetical protein AMAG_19173 [Allomyces macrogynus ATCC 38327]|uniref:Uncharacterized protein n=1 Tax=Allomyces macrogynus (strain ATCC 38327) TaxID=578462 RepID=A0A0L0SPT5_ALLM3|nr:hypothetical protein AMAG_19173 [Allomyces macrogynus ATCC 38327]|eukprot:KNE64501.1 hypothetical protein AMAG_19173 [Allomyces macrogynus ATCC 38327]
MSQHLVVTAGASQVNNHPAVNVAIASPADGGGPSDPPSHPASLSLTGLPDEILFLIFERILDGEPRCSKGFIAIESFAARSLIALCRSCHTFFPLVKETMRCSLAIRVGVVDTRTEDLTSCVVVAPGMPVRPAPKLDAGCHTTWARSVLAVGATPEPAQRNSSSSIEAKRVVVCVPDFESGRTLPVPACLIHALTIEGFGATDLQNHFLTVLGWLARYFPRLSSFDFGFGLKGPPRALEYAIQYWARTLTELRLLVVSVRPEGPAMMLHTDMQLLPVSVDCVRAQLAQFAPTLRKLIIILSSMAEDEVIQLLGPTPLSFRALHELSASVAVLDMLASGISTGVALPAPLRTLTVYPNNFALIHRPLVQFPLLPQLSRVELNQLLVTEHVLENLAAAAPSLATLNLVCCSLACDKHAAPVSFPRLTEIVVDSNKIHLVDLVRVLQGPEIDRVRINFRDPVAPPTVSHLWLSVSTVTLTSGVSLPFDAAILDALPRLRTLKLDMIYVDWDRGIWPDLKSLTALTASTRFLRQLVARRPRVLRRLVELQVINAVTFIPKAVFHTLNRFRASIVSVRVLDTLSRMPNLTMVSLDGIFGAGGFVHEWTLVYRQGNPVWRALHRSTIITHRLVVEVKQIVDADKAARQITTAALSVAKFAVKRPMSLDVVVMADLDADMVSQIGAKLEELPVESVTGRVVVPGAHKGVHGGQS